MKHRPSHTAPEHDPAYVLRARPVPPPFACHARAVPLRGGVRRVACERWGVQGMHAGRCPGHIHTPLPWLCGLRHPPTSTRASPSTQATPPITTTSPLPPALCIQPKPGCRRGRRPCCASVSARPCHLRLCKGHGGCVRAKRGVEVVGSGDGTCARGASAVVRCGGEVHKQVRGGDGSGSGGAMEARPHRVRAHAEAYRTVAPHHFRLRKKKRT